MIRKIFASLQNKNGETLIELVLSIALFSISILTVMTMFLTAQNILKNTSTSERNANQMVNELVTETNIRTQDIPLTLAFTDPLNPSKRSQVPIILQKITSQDFDSQQSFCKWKYGGAN